MSQQEQIYLIPLKQIEISESNVRQTDRKTSIEDLAESIKKHGLLQPVVLSGNYGKPPYELIVGQRRFLAHQILGMNSIKAIFCEKVNEIDLKILSLSENMHRVDLNHADKAEAITALYLHYNKNVTLVANELGLSESTVREYIRIEAQATQKAKHLMRKKEVSKEDVKRAISAAQGDPDKTDRLLDEIGKLSKYEKNRAVNYGKANPKSTVKQIIEEGKKAKLEPTIVLNLTKEVDDALNEAKKQLSMDKESIATKALEEWLKEKGFLKFERK